MKLVCYIKESHEQLALLVGDILYDMDVLHPELPSTMGMFLNYWEDYFPLAKVVNESIEQGKISFNKGIPLVSANLISPVPLPAACLSVFGSAAEAVPEALSQDETFKHLPDFYFTNHHSVQGPGEVNCMPDHLKKLDFELGIAIVVCAHGRNITAAVADQYIGGFMIRNCINTRSRTISNDPVNPSLSKGKDIAIVLGPWLITPDELEPFQVPAREGHTGNNYNLSMKCRVNNEEVSEGNMADMSSTFAEILAGCAYGADIQPGDIIGSGTARGGCYFDINETAKQKDPDYIDRWLQAGDVVEIEIDGLGISTSRVMMDNG
ncbi:MAG: fumarylacetoacetate hydrolase family protein [Chitinophagaceae bacterium]